MFEEEDDPSRRSFFSEIISSIADVKFSRDGRYIFVGLFSSVVGLFGLILRCYLPAFSEFHAHISPYILIPRLRSRTAYFIFRYSIFDIGYDTWYLTEFTVICIDRHRSWGRHDEVGVCRHTVWRK